MWLAAAFRVKADIVSPSSTTSGGKLADILSEGPKSCRVDCLYAWILICSQSLLSIREGSRVCHGHLRTVDIGVIVIDLV
jgi:hypothetical protein